MEVPHSYKCGTFLSRKNRVTGTIQIDICGIQAYFSKISADFCKMQEILN
jgi:hypothetical protein